MKSPNSFLLPVISAILVILVKHEVLPSLWSYFDSCLSTSWIIGLGEFLMQIQYPIILSMIFVMREFLLVSLSTAQFVARWFTSSICFKNFNCSLSLEFLHCFSDRKSHGENFIINREAPHTSQL